MANDKIIIILCDTLRAKSLLHYGNTRSTMPNLNPVVEKDFTVYNTAYAPSSWTTPSHLSLFTGLYPSQVMETPTVFSLNPVFKTLPELFRDSGYGTGAFSANELVSKKFGFNKGFDSFFQLWLPDPGMEELMFSLKGDSRFEKLLTLFRSMAKKDLRDRTIRGMTENLYKNVFRKVLNDATPTTNRAMRMLKRYITGNNDKSLFCFVNLMQVHEKYNPPRVTRNRFVKQSREYEEYYKQITPLDHYALKPFSGEFIEYLQLRYEEEILYLDIVIADFIKFLKDNKLYDNCTLVITSDHGEHFGENGHFAHTFSVFEPLIKIPMYIKWQGRAENHDKTVNKPVMLQDLYSTFLNMTGHWLPCPVSSIDLTSATKRAWALSQLPDMSHNIKGCQEKRQSFSIKELGLEGSSLTAYVFADGTKIIENNGKFSCYDLNIDPGESSAISVSAGYAEEIKRIKNAVV